MSPRDAFERYDEPVNIDLQPEEALKLLLRVGRTLHIQRLPEPDETTMTGDQ